MIICSLTWPVEGKSCIVLVVRFLIASKIFMSVIKFKDGQTYNFS